MDRIPTSNRRARRGRPSRTLLAGALAIAWLATSGIGPFSTSGTVDEGDASRAIPVVAPDASTLAAVAVERSADLAFTEAQDADQEGAPEEAVLEDDHEEDHIDVAHFFLVIISILIFAKVFGELAERIGQPAVLGELIAGTILGASVLGIVPSAIAGGSLAEVIHLLAEVGVAILLFEIGLETDLKEMFRVGAASGSVAIVGVTLPFALGFGYWYFFEPVIGAGATTASLAMVAIFVGATLTATSVGITARVLTDLRLMHRSESKIIIGAAVIDDVLGLVILAVVSRMAEGDEVTALGIAGTLLVAVGFLVVAVIVGNMLAPWTFKIIDRMRVRGVLLVSAFAIALLFAALADLAGSAMIIGAFAAGIVLSSTNQFDLIVERIEPVADVFTPIFFVSVGANVDLGLFNPLSASFDAEVIKVGAILVAVAVIGKLAAGYVVGWGKEALNRTAIGIGMVPRGEVGLIFAQIGLTAGLLSSETFSAILIMVIVTTFIAPPLLKVVFRGDGGEGGDDEAANLGGSLHGETGVPA